MHLPITTQQLSADELRAGLNPGQASTLRLLGLDPSVFVKATLKRLIDDPAKDPELANFILAARMAGKNPEDAVSLSLDGGRPHLVAKLGALK